MPGKPVPRRLLASLGVLLLLSVTAACGPALQSLWGFQVHVYPRSAEGNDPQEVKFITEITGGPDNLPWLHCETAELNTGDGRIIARMPMCQRWTPTSQMPRSFEWAHTYEKPGIYEVSSSYGPLKSSPVLLEVI